MTRFLWYALRVSTKTRELIRICEALPENKRTEVAEFARCLLARQDDERWSQLLNDPGPRPRLDQFMRDSAAEGEAPLDAEHL